MTRKSKRQLSRAIDRIESTEVGALDDFAIGCWSVDTDGRLVGLIDIIGMNRRRSRDPDPDRRPDSAVPLPPSPDRVLAFMEDPPAALDDALDDDDLDRRDPANYINLPTEHEHLEGDIVEDVEALIDVDGDPESDRDPDPDREDTTTDTDTDTTEERR